jgi:hypothetical protein
MDFFLDVVLLYLNGVFKKYALSYATRFLIVFILTVTPFILFALFFSAIEKFWVN